MTKILAILKYRKAQKPLIYKGKSDTPVYDQLEREWLSKYGYKVGA